jgi:subtilase family serine protease
LTGKEALLRSRRFTALIGTVGATFGVLLCMGGTASAKPMHWLDSHVFASPPTTAQCEAAIGLACYSPQQFQKAYNMNSLYQQGLTGRGRTIVIVDSFGAPTIASELAQFDKDFGLPAPPWFKIIQPAGPVPPFTQRPDGGNWAVETSLDVEYAHAMAPGANILLVETPVDETEGVQGLPEMMSAENYVINHNLGDVITQSFGATEETFPSASSIKNLRSAFQNALAHNVTVLGASGDGGATDYESDLVNFYPFRVNSWPSSDPFVTSVGGTQLHLNANGARTAPDNVWNDTALFGGPAAGGGGVSSVFTRPLYQKSVAAEVGSMRGTPDVSLSAAVDGAALVYLHFPGASAGYYLVGGTSEASPMFSGVVAVADQKAGHRLGLLNPTLYQLAQSPNSGLVDITAGNNTVTFTNPGPSDPGTFTVQGFDAVPGYDLSSGLGTVDGTRLVDELSRASNTH